MSEWQNEPEESKHASTQEIWSSDGVVRLSRLDVSDAVELFSLIETNREHFSEFGDITIGRVKDRDELLEKIKHTTNPGKVQYKISTVENKLIGVVSLNPDPSNFAYGEISYYLGKEHTRKGYMSRAVNSLVDYAFSHLGFRTIYGIVFEDNTASVNILKRSGFTEQNRIDEEIHFYRHKLNE